MSGRDGLQMDPVEIAIEYKTAANRGKQIRILAELNCCSKEKIVEILEKQGIRVDKRGLRLRDPSTLQAAALNTEATPQPAKPAAPLTQGSPEILRCAQDDKEKGGPEILRSAQDDRESAQDDRERESGPQAAALMEEPDPEGKYQRKKSDKEGKPMSKEQQAESARCAAIDAIEALLAKSKDDEDGCFGFKEQVRGVLALVWALEGEDHG